MLFPNLSQRLPQFPAGNGKIAQLKNGLLARHFKTLLPPAGSYSETRKASCVKDVLVVMYFAKRPFRQAPNKYILATKTHL
jgi:hypothetical protein